MPISDRNEEIGRALGRAMEPGIRPGLWDWSVFVGQVAGKALPWIMIATSAALVVDLPKRAPCDRTTQECVSGW